MTSPHAPVTAAHLEQFHRDGYFLLERVLPEQHLQLLRDRVMYHIGRADGIMQERGTDVLGINRKGSRYFVSAYREGDTALAPFLFSDLMEQITRATLGDNVYLFYEQYVVKAAETGARFSWHQDSGYVGHDHRPYLSCWVTLDDVNEENGTVYMLPYERAGTRNRVEHTRDTEINDLVGYFGDEPGVPIIAPAGSIAVFSSTTFHRSGANATPAMRRVYLAQYSPEVILKKDGSGPWGCDDAFIVNGVRVR